MNFWERLKYTKKRGWFYRRTVCGISFPYIASERDIDIDSVWMDERAIYRKWVAEQAKRKK